MKAVKYLCYFIIGFVVLVLALFASLVLFLNPNDYKDKIQTLVKEKAGIHLEIKGDINWTFYPWLGLSIQDTTAASLTTLDKPFAKVKELDLSVKLLPLFKGNIEMNDISITGIDINLERGTKGNTNWDKVGQPTTADKTKPSKDETNTDKPKEKSSTPSNLNLNIHSITINDTQITYNDYQAEQSFKVNNVHLSTGVITFGKPITIKFGADLNSTNPKLSTTFNLESNLTYDLNAERYEMKNLHLTSSISGDMFNGKTVKLIANGDLLADLKANTAAWNRLDITLDELKLNGNLNVTDLTANPTVKGSLSALPFNLHKVLTDIGIVLPDMADSKALTQVSFSSAVTASTKAAALNNLQIKLDNTALNGNVSISDFATQAIKVQLKADTINLDNYLAPEKKQTQKTTATTGQSTQVTINQPIWSTDPIVDPKMLRSLNIDTDIVFDQLIIKKLPWQNLTLKATAKNGTISLQNAGGKLFGGDVNLKANINTGVNSLQINLQPTVKNLPIEKVLETQGAEKPSIRGTLNLSGNLRANGLSQATLAQNLNGTANFIVNNGALIGENFDYQVCKAIALVRKEQLTTQFNRTETLFKELKGSLNFTNGVANNQDLIIAIAGFETTGKGTFNLVNMMVDYHIGITLTGEQNINGDAACKVNKDVSDITFPLVCKGSVLAGGNLCGIDSSAIGQMAIEIGKAKLKEEGTKAIDKALSKEKEKLNKKLGETVGNKLSEKLDDKAKGLLNGLLK